MGERAIRLASIRRLGASEESFWLRRLSLPNYGSGQSGLPKMLAVAIRVFARCFVPRRVIHAATVFTQSHPAFRALRTAG